MAAHEMTKKFNLEVVLLGWGDPPDRKFYRTQLRYFSRYETSLDRKKIGGMKKRERLIGATLYVSCFAAFKDQFYDDLKGEQIR